MTAPRQILEGATYLVTRRCAQRQFLLTPTPLVNAILKYLLAVAARRYGVQIHAYCVMSNHLHLVVTDPGARLPMFEQYLDGLGGRALNAALGRREALWKPSSYSAVRLLEPADVVDKTAYVLANPVAAGLVQTGRAWPGLWSAPESVGGEPVQVERPRFFFRAKGTMPPRVELELTVPPGFGSAAEFREAVARALEEREAKAVWAAQAAGRGFLGEERVRAQAPASRPKSEEPRVYLNPRIACRDEVRRKEAIGGLLDFLRAYRAALRALRRGVEGVLFPYGTYWLRVAHRVPCAAAG